MKKIVLVAICIYCSLLCCGQSVRFYSVYEFSPNTAAIVINFSETNQPSVFDSLYDKIVKTTLPLGKPTGCSTYDASGPYTLLRNEQLETEIKKHLPKTFFVYGTKGMKECAIDRVVFAFDECRTNFFAFPIKNFDEKKYGHPVICSAQPLELHYRVPVAEEKIKKLVDESDFRDSVATQTFATLDSLHFTYTDDFAWGKKRRDNKCYFPARCVFVKQQDNNFELYWGDDLDLFGVPCD